MAQSTHYSGDKPRDLREKAGEQFDKMADTVEGKARDLRDKAGEQFDKVADGVEGTMRNVAERGREVGENMQVVASNFRTAVDKSVREQPMATLAVVAAVGFVLGALWKT